ncbi:polysaccharide lyase 6 family protein [Shewanella sp. 10N.286.51.B7]|uniref:polysaccharide lyase 6 family protein n=1 Tax=Shewanella sp. 10N.286.51.B7 TaxID=1880836 RepID=UPI001F53D49C|nr:polysaccharide lyase 6 family protein [Shewanella sp. 10N.286.51.B7]
MRFQNRIKLHSVAHSTLLSVPVKSTLLMGLCLLSVQVNAETFTVSTQDEFNQAVKKLAAGDDIILSNGTWQDFEINFIGQGSKEAPIRLSAQTKGKVILSGQSNLQMSGTYLEVSGLVFKDGYTPNNSVISYRTSEDELANHSRVTEVVIDNFNNPDRHESDYWVALYGQHNRFDHNHLVGKRNKGVTLTVRLRGEDSQQNHHRIDHNYFGPRPTLGSNGGETIRIGTSHFSMTNSYTVIEDNYFDRCDGEVEIISIKAGKNIIRNNTFFESRGTLTMRHGNGNQVDSNVFLGNGVDHTGGIRIINRDQTITNNYLEGLKGYRFGSGFTIMNGVPNSPINRYHQVVNAKVSRNSFINVDHIHLAAGSDKERSAVPKDSAFTHNLFVNNNQQAPFSIFDDISGIQFSDNLSNELNNNQINQGIKPTAISLQRADNGLFYPSNSHNAEFGATQTLTPTLKANTGVSWYTKAEPNTAFDSGITHSVSTAEQLLTAVSNAKDGDIIALKAGKYQIEKIIEINKTLSIIAQDTQKPTLTFSRGNLFEIQNGGSLKLDSLIITGTSSPDSSGNTVVRTSKWGMLTNYRFSMYNSKISQLNINHSFHFFDSGARAFANKIEVINNQFSTITGDLFRLNKETDDRGIYNVEYLTINNNQFNDIGGALVKLYRGGTDESTFGPHISFNNNDITNVGNGKQNKSQASLYLHGAQVADINKNHFNNSAYINIEHTTGEPMTQVTHNQFIDSGAVKVTELYSISESTAKLSDNLVQQSDKKAL